MNRAERRRQQKLAAKAGPRKPNGPKAGTPEADTPEAHYTRGSMLHDKGDIAGAIDRYRSAIALRPDFAEAHYNLGIALKDGGNLAHAVAHFRKAAEILPHLLEMQNNLGTALVDIGKPDEAVAAYQKALSISPDDAGIYFNLGVAFKESERWDEAIASYRQAIVLNPSFADAYFNLTQIFEMTNRVEDLRAIVAEGKRHYSGDRRIAFSEACILKRDGYHAAARSALEAAGKPILDPVFLAERAYFLGDLCDRLDDPSAAFQYFAEGGRYGKEVAGSKRLDGTRFQNRIGVLRERFTADWVTGWQEAEPGCARPDPVFLIGFPRSGTTLLDTILRSHAAITVVEEAPAIHNANRPETISWRRPRRAGRARSEPLGGFAKRLFRGTR